MENILQAGGGLVLLGIILFLIVLVILWIVLPFAVFGIKSRLDAVLTEAKAMNLYLKDIRDSVYTEVDKQHPSDAPRAIRVDR